MDELGMTSRRFSLGARGYNQDEVDSYLAGIAERMMGPNANPAREASRIAIASFSVVTLGYSRSEVNRYLGELRETFERRAQRRPAGAIAVAYEDEVVEAAEPQEPAVPAEPEALELDEPEAADEEPEVADEAAEPAFEEPAEPVAGLEPEQQADILYADGNGSASPAYAARVTAAVNGDGATPAAERAERAALFATALDLRIDGAVAMTRDELQAAIDDARGVEDAPAAENAVDEEPVHDAPQAEVAGKDDDLRRAVLAALHEIRAAMDALEALVAGEMPAEEEAEVAEPDPEPAATVDNDDNGGEQAPDATAAHREPVRYGPVSYSAEPRPGLLNLTRDIIRLARGGMVTRR